MLPEDVDRRSHVPPRVLHYRLCDARLAPRKVRLPETLEIRERPNHLVLRPIGHHSLDGPYEPQERRAPLDADVAAGGTAPLDPL
eukprot:7349678-Pyramimonas_sp.AAC.1